VLGQTQRKKERKITKSYFIYINKKYKMLRVLQFLLQVTDSSLDNSLQVTDSSLDNPYSM
jgi:hypothetical protein